MSDEPKQDEVSPPETPAPLPPDAATAPAPNPEPRTPDPKSQTPSAASRPPIDYAMPAQKKSWLPTPQLVRNVGCLVKLLAAFTFLLCLAYFALVALNPKARQWALQGTKPGPGGAPPSGKGPTPFKAINQILAIPAQAMGKTDDVVKANNARVGVLDGVIKQEEGKAAAGTGSHGSRPVTDPFASSGGTAKPDAARAAGAAEAAGESGPQAVAGSAILALAEKRGATIAPDPEAPEPRAQTPRPQTQDPGPQTPNEMKLAGDIVITNASPAGAPRASAAFFYAIVKLNVSGITQGRPGRALINNRLAYEGDEINRPLGVVFAELDVAGKRLVFKDASGATVTRSY